MGKNEFLPAKTASKQKYIWAGQHTIRPQQDTCPLIDDPMFHTLPVCFALFLHMTCKTSPSIPQSQCDVCSIISIASS
jgi:hypothetical protein